MYWTFERKFVKKCLFKMVWTQIFVFIPHSKWSLLIDKDRWYFFLNKLLENQRCKKAWNLWFNSFSLHPWNQNLHTNQWKKSTRVYIRITIKSANWSNLTFFSHSTQNFPQFNVFTSRIVVRDPNVCKRYGTSGLLSTKLLHSDSNVLWSNV